MRATLFTEREEGSGHAATIELSPRQKLAVTNEIRTLHRLHLLSWSSNSFTICLANVSYITALFDNCVPRRQLVRCSVTRPFLSLQRVWLPKLHVHPHICHPHICTLTSAPSHLHPHIYTHTHRVWETVFFKKAEGSLADNVPSFFNISVCGSVPPQQNSQCSGSSVCYSEHLDKFYSLGTAASCDVSYANRQVQFQFEFSQSAANIFGHGNVSVTLVCGRNLVSLLIVLHSIT